MDLEDIVSVSGMPGLHRLKTHTKDGFIVESLDSNNIKFIRNISNRLVPLENITIFTTEEDDIELEEIFERILKNEKEHPPVDPKADGAELKTYFATIVPEYDDDQVYTSDIKKTIQWYHILKEHDIIKPKKKKKKKSKSKKKSKPSASKKSKSKKSSSKTKQKGKKKSSGSTKKKKSKKKSKSKSKKKSS